MSYGGLYTPSNWIEKSQKARDRSELEMGDDR